MQSFLLHAGVTFAICWTATIIPASPVPHPAAIVATDRSSACDPPHIGANHEADTWRRTAQGWERASDWIVEKPLDTPPICIPFLHLHPLLVASFQGLISVGALIAATPADEIAVGLARLIPQSS